MHEIFNNEMCEKDKMEASNLNSVKLQTTLKNRVVLLHLNTEMAFKLY